MGPFALIVIVAAVTFGLLMIVFAVGRTLHRSEIGRNPEMKKRGIQCTAEWMRSHECNNDNACGESSCEGCNKLCR